MLNLVFGFTGRIDRGSWWLGQVILIILVLLLFALPIMKGQSFSGIISSDPALDTSAQLATWSQIEIGVFALLFCWVWLAFTVKRLHDHNRSAAWAMVGFLPTAIGAYNVFACPLCSGDLSVLWILGAANVINFVVQPILFSYCGMKKGDDGPNDYGPPPGTIPDDATPSSGGRLANLDDDYFRTYAAQTQHAAGRMAEPMVQSTYDRPAGTVTTATGFGGKSTFGRR